MNCIREQENYRYLLDELYSIYDEYELKHSDYRCYLQKGTDILSYIMKLTAFIVMLMVLGMGVVTLILTLVFGMRELIVQCIIPGVDVNTDRGFLITCLTQISFVAVGGFGFYAGDMAFFTPVSQVVTFSGILKCKFQDLNVVLDYDTGDKKNSIELLKDIIVFHQRYMR